MRYLDSAYRLDEELVKDLSECKEAALSCEPAPDTSHEGGLERILRGETALSGMDQRKEAAKQDALQLIQEHDLRQKLRNAVAKKQTALTEGKD